MCAAFQLYFHSHVKSYTSYYKLVQWWTLFFFLLFFLLFSSFFFLFNTHTTQPPQGNGTNVWGPEDTPNFVRDRTPLAPLRFNIGDKVLANALGGWKTGTVIMIWDHGNPYRIELEDGTNVWGPEDIDKFVIPWSQELPPMPSMAKQSALTENEHHGHGHGGGHGGHDDAAKNSDQVLPVVPVVAVEEKNDDDKELETLIELEALTVD